MPSSITVRETPDDALKELKARAARRGQSLQEYMRAHIVEMASKADVNELMDRVRERVRRTDTRISPEEIVHLRDMDRR